MTICEFGKEEGDLVRPRTIISLSRDSPFDRLSLKNVMRSDKIMITIWVHTTETDGKDQIGNTMSPPPPT